jgi:thiamine pyrophosphate-dependent acetolactate synthase large subunit-like protein
MISAERAIQAIAERRGDAIVIPTMMTARVWPRYSKLESHDLPLNGCMGKASSLGLGIALARPERRVIVLDGDGSLLMNLGSLVTIANARPRNLVHCVFENGIYEVTGGQPVPGEGTFSFATIAKGAGFPNAYELSDEATFEAQLDEAFSKPGPTFITFRVTPVGENPRGPRRTTASAIGQVREVLTAGG